MYLKSSCLVSLLKSALPLSDCISQEIQLAKQCTGSALMYEVRELQGGWERQERGREGRREGRREGGREGYKEDREREGNTKEW